MLWHEMCEQRPTVLIVVVSTNGWHFVGCSGHGKRIGCAHRFRIWLSNGKGDEIQSNLADGN